MRIRHQTAQGSTLAEVMVAVLIVAAFFSGLFELNAVSLRYISASKDSVGAIEGVHDRIEALRSLAFSALTSSNYMTVTTGTDPVTGVVNPGLLQTPSNSSPIATTKATETVVLTDFPGGATSVTYTRSPGASSTPTASWSPAGTSAFPTTTNLVRVDVTYQYNASLGGRIRTEQTSTIISDGQKK